MTDHRKRYDNTFKAKVALESFKNEKTIGELANDYDAHPNQITNGESRPSKTSLNSFLPIRS